jgi:outer membrane protein assembly factor BamB
MNKHFFLLFAGLFILSNAFAETSINQSSSKESYYGVVYQDNNRNGKQDADEPGLAGVSVSDGLHVVQTSQDGNYALPGFERTRFIQITIPSGYELSTPFFQRVEKGVPQYHFGILPNKSKKSENDEVKLIQISDTETPEVGQWINDIQAYAKNHEVDFIIHNGDICYEPGMRMHAREFTTERLGVPVFYTVGNHDLIKNLSHGEALFEELFGPTHYSFEVGAARVIVTPMPIGDAVPSYTQASILEWLQNDLSTLRPDQYIIFVHHRPATGKQPYTLTAGDQTINLLDYRLKAWFNGHWHTNYIFKDRASGVYNVTTAPARVGGKDNSPARFVVAEFNNNGLASVKTEHPFLSDHASVVSPNAMGQLFSAGANELLLSINAYDSQRRIESITAFLKLSDGSAIQLADLSQRSAWNWEAEVPISSPAFSSVFAGRKHEIEFLLEYQNGQSTKAYQALVWESPATTSKDASMDASALLKQDFRPLWVKNVGAPVWKSSPLMGKHQIYIATAADTYPEENVILALDKKSGAVNWTHPVKNAIRSTLQLDAATGYLLATDLDGTVYALEEKTGKLQWTYQLQGDKVSRAYVSGSILSDGVYYTGAGVYLQALDVKTGQSLWKNTAWSNEDATSASMLIYENLLITGSNWTSLFAHDLKDGSLAWSLKDNGTRYRSSTGLVNGEVMYLASNKNLYKIHAGTGEILTQTTTDYVFNVMAQPTIHQGQIVVATANAGIVAFDLDSFEERWKFTPRESLIYTAPYTGKGAKTVENTVLVHGNRLIFGASDGYLYVLDAATGQALHQINLGAPIISTVVIDENSLLSVADYAGNVYAFYL